MNKKLLSLTFLCLGLSWSLSSMHNDQGQLAQFAQLPNLPENLKVTYFKAFIKSAQTLEQALALIQNLGQVNHAFRQLLLDPAITRAVIRELSVRFNINPLECAALLNTPAALQWLRQVARLEAKVLYFMPFLAEAQDINQVIKILRDLQATNKTARLLLTDQQLAEHLIVVLSERFNLGLVACAALLSTPGSIEWLRNNMLQDKQYAQVYLDQAITDGNATLIQAFIESGVIEKLGLTFDKKDKLEQTKLRPSEVDLSRPTESPIQNLPQTTPTFDNLSGLPTKLKVTLMDFLARAETVAQAIGYIQTLGQTNQQFRQLLLDKAFTLSLIEKLSKRFKLSELECGALLHTPPALEWLSHTLEHEVPSDYIVTDLLPDAIARNSYALLKALLHTEAGQIWIWGIKGLESFFDAIKTGNNRLLRIVLESVIATNDFSKSEYLIVCETLLRNKIPFVAAVESDNIQTRELILSYVTPRTLVSALVRASELGFVNGVKLLLRRYHTTDNPQITQDTLNQALISATEQGNKELVELLLSHNAHIDSRRANDNYTPLMIAVQNNNKPLAQLLLQKGANLILRNHHENTALDLAIRNRRPGISHLLLDNGAQLHRWNYATQEREFFDLVLAQREQLNDLTATGNIQAIQELRSQEVTLSPKAIKMFATLYKDLFDAIEKGDLTKIRWLIKNGLSVNIRGANGNTPLHRAMRLENGELIRLLLAIGANPYVLNNAGETPMHLCDKRELLEIIAEFIALPEQGPTRIQYTQELLNPPQGKCSIQ